MGHCNYSDVIKTENVVEGMKLSNKQKLDCTTCLLGKMTQNTNKKSDSRAKGVFDLVHVDLAGPVTPTSINGHRYSIAFTDDLSGSVFTYFLKNKNEAIDATERFLADISLYGKVHTLRSDNGGEFCSNEFKSLLSRNQIRHETSCPNSPHQNGRAERSWRTLFDMARCLLGTAKLSKNLWPYAVQTAAHIRNRCYKERLNMTPYEVITGKKPDVSSMRIFGSEAYAYKLDKTNVQKLDDRCIKGYFVGYDKNSPAYFIYVPAKNAVIKFRVVKFPENNVLDGNIGVDINYDNSDDELDDNMYVNIDCAENEVVNKRRYPQRDRHPPVWHSDYEVSTVKDSRYNIDYCYQLGVHIPNTFDEAISCNDALKWRSAMQEEMNSLTKNDVYEVTKLPSNKQCIDGRWVFTVKYDECGEVKHKARFVAKGFNQRYGIDYEETFAPTAQISSVRMLCQAAVDQNLDIYQMDVKSAYLNATIDKEIFVKTPKGFSEKDDNGDDLVWKLKKSLYGLKQSGRIWNECINDSFLSMGFQRSQADACIYIKSSDQGKVIVLVWVDDILIASNSQDLLNDVKSSLCSKYDMKDLGKLTVF